ncbi:MAG: tRNA (adenosine(37)-N6)-threonylcarbamoyltransferase complex ATPase subunit type 1 TsaE [Candidatus Obscuribacterales bacterium]|nr:tRNA (adenosine(37)-N6)-threonylcarbamoyltransferase complex ATPase subunit type 1 TsaE [Candidatus Obscuribacterales bacterium]
MLQISLPDELCTLKLGEVCGRMLTSSSDDKKLVIGLSGTLGTGKTTFTKGLAKALGISEPVCSPTFTMLNEYSSGALPLYHFDLYRLSEGTSAFGTDELLDEMAELLDSSGVVVVEWIDLFPELLEGVEDVRINFAYCEDGSRLVMIEERNRVSLVQQIRDLMASDT